MFVNFMPIRCILVYETDGDIVHDVLDSVTDVWQLPQIIIVLNPIIICQIKYTFLKVFLNECLLHGIIILHNIDKYLITRKYVRFNHWVNGMKIKYVQAMLEVDVFADEVAKYSLFATESDGNKLENSFTIVSAKDMSCKIF